jgi:hypothetical protein
MALQEDDDTTGDVISVNGQATTENVDKGEAEDRGDVLADELPAKEPAPVPEKDNPAVEVPPEPDTRPQHIPKVRFDEVNNRKNELAAELAEAHRVIESLRAPAAKPAPATFDEDAKEQEYIDAMLDGNADLAKSIRREINANLISQTVQQVRADTAHEQAATSLQQASTQAVADFPYLDTEDGAEALELIIASRDAKIARGMVPAEALRTAVAAIAPKFAPESEAPPSSGLTSGKPAADTRTAAALARGAADSNLQPPTVQAGTGNRATAGRVDVANMSDEQFENLTLAEKRRARGDM